MSDDIIPASRMVVIGLVLVLASVASHQSGLDLWIAHHLSTIEGGRGSGFPWYRNYWLYTVIHEGGRWLVKRLFFIDLGLFIGSFFIQRLRRYRKAFLYIALATLVSTSLISSLKHATTIPCPRALSEFGGQRSWIDFWQLFSADLPRGNCYPAGHASGGYAWLCLMFVVPYRSRWFYRAMIPGAFLGLLFGIAQQLRGNHFLSHDLMTIALCWLVSGGLLFLMRGVAAMVAVTPIIQPDLHAVGKLQRREIDPALALARPTISSKPVGVERRVRAGNGLAGRISPRS